MAAGLCHDGGGDGDDDGYDGADDEDSGDGHQMVLVATMAITPHSAMEELFRIATSLMATGLIMMMSTMMMTI